MTGSFMSIVIRNGENFLNGVFDCGRTFTCLTVNVSDLSVRSTLYSRLDINDELYTVQMSIYRIRINHIITYSLLFIFD